MAEETGLILPLGGWVLREACRQVAEWRSALPGAGALTVSVNLSPRQLHSPTFAGEVQEALTDAGLDAADLTLEITEGVLMHDLPAMSARLAELRRLGVRVAIDDFGTGYSSLAYLRRLPVDILKIDKLFVDDLGAGSDEATLAHVIVTLGHTLHLQTVAEGVERREQADRLRLLGCDRAQGYLFARPLPAADLAAFLAAFLAAQPAA